MQVTPKEGVAIARELSIEFSVENLAKVGFEVVGSANVEAQAATPAPTPKPDPELFAAVELLYNAGRKARPNRDGRTKRVLGDAENLAPYRVMVTKAK